MVLGGSWWLLVVPSGSLWMIGVLGGSWWFLDGSVWFLVVLDNFAVVLSGSWSS